MTLLNWKVGVLHHFVMK